eukprot:m.205383 g.205383  ORF g.205383 m.205383 type:complete len:115 (+) comp32913_c0_seq2:1287-1631(+)
MRFFLTITSNAIECTLSMSETEKLDSASGTSMPSMSTPYELYQPRLLLIETISFLHSSDVNRNSKKRVAPNLRNAIGSDVFGRLVLVVYADSGWYHLHIDCNVCTFKLIQKRHR